MAEDDHLLDVVLLKIRQYERHPRHRRIREIEDAIGEGLLCFVVQVQRQRGLLEIILTLHPPCRLPRRLHRRQQQRDQDADDRNDHEELHEGKTV